MTTLPSGLTHYEPGIADTMTALEAGQVIFLPDHAFVLNSVAEEALLSDTLSADTLLGGSHKNASFDMRTGTVGGLGSKRNTAALTITLQTFMQRYAQWAQELVHSLFPSWQEALRWGRTSYRPAEIAGRKTSKRKDDTRLHVDSFAATPVHGMRILRVFCNINPDNQPRVWHLGEPFPVVLARFADSLPPYSRLKAHCLHWLGLTKTRRSAYDHYQLQLHDAMKRDTHYQQTVAKQRVDFPARSTWIVFTDQVSHAALSGQFLLEQTFYLPVEALENPGTSPLAHWQQWASFPRTVRMTTA